MPQGFYHCKFRRAVENRPQTFGVCTCHGEEVMNQESNQEFSTVPPMVKNYVQLSPRFIHPKWLVSTTLAFSRGLDWRPSAVGWAKLEFIMGVVNLYTRSLCIAKEKPVWLAALGPHANTPSMTHLHHCTISWDLLRSSGLALTACCTRQYMILYYTLLGEQQVLHLGLGAALVCAAALVVVVVDRGAELAAEVAAAVVDALAEVTRVEVGAAAVVEAGFEAAGAAAAPPLPISVVRSPLSM